MLAGAAGMRSRPPWCWILGEWLSLVGGLPRDAGRRMGVVAAAGVTGVMGVSGMIGARGMWVTG